MKILLVDDEREFVSTLAERLAFRGIDAVSVNSGYEALAAMESEDVDLIVMDLKMSGLNGLETMRQIKERYGDVPFIMITGHCEESDMLAGKDMGAYSCMVKPVKIEALLETIERMDREGKIEKHGDD